MRVESRVQVLDGGGGPHAEAVSYDVYFWFRAKGHPTDVLDALAESDLGVLVPDPAVRAFRRDLLNRLPQLADVTEPDEGRDDVDADEPDAVDDAPAHYLVLNLPFPWTTLLPVVLELAAVHGVSGYDPQLGEPVGWPTSAPAAAPRARSANPTQGPWARARIGPELGVSQRWLSRAWALAGLPEKVAFGPAVGVYILALALRDGAQADSTQAELAVNQIAEQCAHGIPTAPAWSSIDCTMTDVTGFARALARGGF